MKIPILITSCLMIFSAVRAGDLPPGAALVKQIEWSKVALPPEAKLEGATAETGSFVSIVNPEEKPVSVTLFSIKEPGIRTKCYALRGRIRYREVAGIGYLQLWNEFETTGAPPSRYFTRTLADTGPTQKISGSSQWREVWLPFDATQSKSFPSALQFDLVLPGRGAVDLGNLELLQFADAGAMWAAMSGERGNAGSFRGWFPAIALGAGIVAMVAAILGRRRRRAERRRMRAMDLQ
ncbi:MAG: hypothetical protein JWL59_2711 [Chthoniobacteraceae bacterium]|nr:hypothetical protein [Chthoniobacteraceae bacterium]